MEELTRRQALLLMAGALLVHSRRSARAQAAESVETMVDSLGREMHCLEYDMAALPGPVKEWLGHSALGRATSAGGSRIRFCAVDNRIENFAVTSTEVPRSKVDDTRQLLRQVIVQTGRESAAKNVDEWFRHVAVARADHSEFLSPIHAEFANDFQIVAESPLVVKLRNGTFLGVNRHPWMSIVDYVPEVTLNNSELAALSPTASFFEKQLRLYTNNQMKLEPFPDTMRLPAQPNHVEAFHRRVATAGLNPGEFHLRYVRYYVMSIVGTSDGKHKPQPLLAEAYQRSASQDLKINFSLVETERKTTASLTDRGMASVGGVFWG